MTKTEIYEFIEKQKTAIISSVDSEGFPATRALIAPRKIDGNRIYFATSISSKKVQHYKNNSKACVYFYEKGKYDFRGVMLKGNMEVITDPAIKKMLWRNTDLKFFKKGIDDSDYGILEFTGFEAECFYNYHIEIVKLME